MKIAKHILKLFFWPFLILALLFFAWIVGSFLIEIFSNASDTVKAASIAALGSVLVLLFGRFLEQRREAKQRINVEKIEVYKKFYEFYFSIFSHEKLYKKQKAGDEIMREMLEFQKDVIFWGSDEVIRAYLDFKDAIIGLSADQSDVKSESNSPEDLAKVLKSVAQLLVSMRRDVGYSFTSVSANDLARLQLATDPETKRVFDHL